MKTLLFCGAFAFGFSAYGQNVTGTYINAEGQKLVITNQQECCFDFEVTWGVDDEWLCLFESSGTAKFADENSAYFGEDPEWADIEFTIDGDVIDILGGYDYIGADCAKFGDSSGETYTRFKK